jgi:threonine synthase
MNAIAKLSAEELAGGVWTVSAGNAAQGVALAAREAGTHATVLVMDTAPATKLAAIERLGASIVKATYDECWKAVETRLSIACRAASSIRSTMTISSAAMERSRSRSSKTSRRSTRSSRRSAAAGCLPASAV